MEIVIREIVLQDAEEVSSLSKQLGYDLSAPQTASQIQEILSSPDNCAFVGLDHEKVIGWVHAFKTIRIETNTFVEIGGLVVDENYRSKGVGKKLVDRIKQWCIEQEIRSLRVRCNIKRTAAHQFYLTLGFSEMKEQKVFGMEL